ncbi:MAG: hypothetical protein RLZZ28_227 [Bacteroidota bacterium]
MKTILFAVLTMGVFSIGAGAQNNASLNEEKNAEMKDLKKDIRDVHRDKAARKHELREGDKAEARKLNRDIREDKKDIKEDRRDLREEGVKHPEKRARKQLREQRRHH